MNNTRKSDVQRDGPSGAEDSFTKLNPVLMMRNPVMFVVEAGTLVVLLMTLFPSYFGTEGNTGFNVTVFVILLLTLLFANFAEALAEGRGKAQADSLKQSKQEMTAHKVMENGGVQSVPSTDLRKGDIVIVTQGEMIPGTGSHCRALRPLTNRRLPASPPPSLKKRAAISARSPGTRVVSDTIRVRITSDPGNRLSTG